MIRPALCRLRRFLRDRSGVATLEFCLAFPPVIYFLCLGAEAGILQLRQAMMEHGMDVAVRELRLGRSDMADPEKLKDAICDNAIMLSECRQNISLDMRVIDPATWDFQTEALACVDHTQPIQPVTSYKTGAKNELMLLRFCVTFEPVLPGAGLGAAMSKLPDGRYALTAATVFVNEPT